MNDNLIYISAFGHTRTELLLMLHISIHVSRKSNKKGCEIFYEVGRMLFQSPIPHEKYFLLCKYFFLSYLLNSSSLLLFCAVKEWKSSRMEVIAGHDACVHFSEVFNVVFWCFGMFLTIFLECRSWICFFYLLS